MVIPVLFITLAALPTISAQSVISVITDRVSSTAIVCTTQYASHLLPTGETLGTSYTSLTVTSTFQITTTEYSTTTITPAPNFSDVITTTNVITTTEFVTPAATTLPTPFGFFPLINTDKKNGSAATAMMTRRAIPRIRRYEHAPRKAGSVFRFPKRQDEVLEAPTWGFQVFDNGTYTNIQLMFPARVDCNVTVQVKETIVTAIDGGVETEFAQLGTAGVVGTFTVERTSTATVQKPAPRIPVACRDDNMVDHIVVNGTKFYFNLVRYRTNSGFPVENEVVSSTEDARSCCIACHTTAFCAGSFWARSIQSCHLRLTQPAANNNNNNNNSSSSSSSSSSTNTTANNTCAHGSLSLYMGYISGEANLSSANALTFSNGPCGWFSVDPRG